MLHQGQSRIGKSSASFGTKALASAILLILMLVASPVTKAQTFQVLHTFEETDGRGPYAGLTIDQAGNFYGTTHNGGKGILSPGTIFRLQRSGSNWSFTTLYNFTGDGYDGEIPAARVILGPDGSLYGTAAGIVFNLRPAPNSCQHPPCAWIETVISQSVGGESELIFDQGWNIYGTAQYGAGRKGEVYELMRSGEGWSGQILYSFSGNDGAYPYAGVIFDKAGNLYGTTFQGGDYNAGTVFELSPSADGWTEKVLYSFQNGSDGGYPWGGVIFDQSGNLYGSTSAGGSGNGGTVFRLSPSSGGWALNTLYSFPGQGQGGPHASLTFDGSGNLYGTTYQDGAHPYNGSVFKLTPTSQPPWIYTSLHDFTGGSDGANPISNVIMDGGGNLYGTASEGGDNHCFSGVGCGVVWEITP